MVIEQKSDLRQLDVYEKLKRKMPVKVAQFINANVNWMEAGNPVFLDEVPKSDGPVEAYQRVFEMTENANCIVCEERLNDVRYINKFLETLNRRLPEGGYFVASLETSGQRRDRLMERYPAFINRLVIILDYFIARVIPKLQYFKGIYFSVTQGKNRAISEMETYGRLYSCGFKLVDSVYLEGRLYFIARKEKEPDYNLDPTYGPLIRLRRVGKAGKIIKVYKFRTMYPYSEYLQAFIYERYGLGKGCKMKDDPRVNEVGRFCRKYWLDEIPMLMNLLKGDLKLFGVRPISQHYFSLYPKDFQEYRNQFKPGLVPPLYVEVPKTMEDVVRIERTYLEAYERQPLWTDIKYCFLIFHSIVFKKIRSN